MAQLLLLLHRRCAHAASRLLVLPGSRAGRDHASSAPAAADGLPPLERDRGQATTEYALVMLGAAVVALLVVTWATAGGGAGKIGQLFDRVIDAVAGRI